MAEQLDIPEQKPKVCQAQGCQVDVNAFGRYCKKRRLCPEHLKAPSLRRKKYGEERWRFCQQGLYAALHAKAAFAQPAAPCLLPTHQGLLWPVLPPKDIFVMPDVCHCPQCGKLELLSKFDGLKRSCRVQLARRRAVSGSRGSGAAAAAERRRSNATEGDRTSSEEGNASERLLEEGDNNAAAAAAAARVGGPGTGLLHGFSATPEAGQVRAAAGLPSSVDLAAAIMQQEVDNVLNAQLLQQQQLQQQQEMFGLQQQHQYQQHHQQQQRHQQQGTLQLAAASPAVRTTLPAAAASMTARSVAPTSGGDLLLQLLRDQQQLRGWQQLQPGGLSAGPDTGSGIADVYSAGLGSNTVAAEPPSGFSTGAAGGNTSLGSMRGQHHQQQQQPAHSFQHSGSQQQQALAMQRQSVDDMQSFPRASHSTIASSGSMNAAQGPAGAAVDAGHMGPAGPVFSADAHQQSSMALLQDATGSSGLSLAQFVQQQQQQQQQRELLGCQQGTPDPFFETTLGAPQPQQRSRYTPLPEFEALEEMLAAAAGAPSVSRAGAAAAHAAGVGGGPSELPSLSSPDAQTPSLLLLLDPRGGGHYPQQQQQQRPQLRAIDSAPARLTLPAERASRAGAAGQVPTCGGEMQGSGFLAAPNLPGSLFDHGRPQGPQGVLGDNPYGDAAAGTYAAEAGGPGGAAWQHPGASSWVPEAYSQAPINDLWGPGGGGMHSGMLPAQRTQQVVQECAGAAGAGGLQRRGAGLTQQLQISRERLAAELQALLDSTR